MITDKIEYEYSLDDQCRMEFDRGFSFCRSFQLADPCEHLWCAHSDTPLLCKTKKGPPMDGTACGPDKVCIGDDDDGGGDDDVDGGDEGVCGDDS